MDKLLISILHLDILKESHVTNLSKDFRYFLKPGLNKGFFRIGEF